jgi:hypothetical protein
MLAIDCIDMNQARASSLGKSWRALLWHWVYIFLRERRGLNPTEAKVSPHLHAVEDVYCRKVALGEVYRLNALFL